MNGYTTGKSILETRPTHHDSLLQWMIMIRLKDELTLMIDSLLDFLLFFSLDSCASKIESVPSYQCNYSKIHYELSLIFRIERL